MKKTDIAMIVLIAAVSAGIAYFVANNLFGNVSEQTVKVQTIDPITSVVEPVNTTIFNENSINPSVEVNINNTEPTSTSDSATPSNNTP